MKQAFLFSSISCNGIASTIVLYSWETTLKATITNTYMWNKHFNFLLLVDAVWWYSLNSWETTLKTTIIDSSVKQPIFPLQRDKKYLYSY